MKPSILCVADVPGWAVDNCTAAMIAGMPEFDWTKIYWTQTSGVEMARLISEHDICYLGNHDYGPRFADEFHHVRYRMGSKRPLRIVVTFRSFRYQRNAVDFAADYAMVVTAPCPKLAAELLPRCADTRYIPDGIPEMFAPSRPLRVGFVGEAGDYKGTSLIEQACREIGAEFVAATRQQARRYEDMPRFYCENVDVIVVASLAEGFCAPLVEAMAMNVPVITTDVGVASELDCIKIPRSVDGIVKGLDRLFGRRQVWPQFSWKKVNQQFRELLQGVAA